MSDKYKVRVSLYTYKALIDDMVRFNFYKPSGELNKNEFYNRVVVGLYNNYLYRYSFIKRILNYEFSTKYDNDMIHELAGKINNNIIEELNYDKDVFYYKKDIYIQVTKNTKNIYDQIEENELKNETMSDFLRKLFNEFIFERTCNKEKILFWDQYFIIESAIEERYEIIISTKNNVETRIRPYARIVSSNNHQNYIIGLHVLNDKEKLIAIKLSKVISVVKTRVKFSLTKAQIKYIEERLLNGPEYLSDNLTTVNVTFDKYGQKKYEKFILGRPHCFSYDEKKQIYTFKCDENIFFNYLIQFGKHVNIISPKELRDKVKRFHHEASI